MRLHLLLSTALALSPAMYLAAPPAHAEVTDVGIELAKLQTEIAQLQARANDFMVADVYECPPPNPIQLELQALGRLSAKSAELNRRYRAAREDGIANAFRGNSGDKAAADFPAYGHLKFELNDSDGQKDYWSAYKTNLDNIDKTIKAKEDALRRARVINCQGSTPKRDIAVQPPLPPTPPPPPPPPPPEPPKERSWDPMAGLVRPELKAADLPVFPNFFCTEAEKQAMLARIEPAKAKAQSSADANDAYAQQIEARKAQLVREGLPPHWQTSMDHAAKNARFERDSHLSTIRALNDIKRQIEITPVVDCTTPPKKEPTGALKSGWDLRGGLEYGTGNLQLPDAGYLGLENPATTQRINGILRAANEDSGFRRIGGHIEVPLNWAPWNVFAPVGGQLTETRLRAGFFHTSADAVRFGRFNPTGDTLFFPGLSNNIADTISLPSTFNATVRDNRVDEFRSEARYRLSELSLDLLEDFAFAGCDDFTLTKTFGFQQRWTDRRDVFRAEVRDYFPVAFPNFNVRSDYNSRLDSATSALKLGLDGTYAPASWNGVFLSAGLDGWLGRTKTDGSAVRVMDINGGVSEQRAAFNKSETTTGFGLRAGVGYDFGGGKIELGVEYREDGDSPTIQYGAGVPPAIDHGHEAFFLGTLRTTFTF